MEPRAKTSLTVDFDRWRTDGRRPPLLVTTSRFWGSVDGLRQAAPAVEAELDRLHAGASPADIMAGWLAHVLPEPERSKLRSVVASLASDPGTAAAAAERVFDDVFSTHPEALVAIAGGALQTRFSFGTPLALSALLVSAVAAFEALLAGLAAEHLRRFPAMLLELGDDRKFSFAELDEFETLEEVRDEAIDRRVESLLRKDLSAWSRWSEHAIGHPFAEWYCDDEATAEIFQRRHSVVHSAGVVTRHYLRHVAARFHETPGTQLHVNAEYFTESLDRLEILGSLIAWHASVKWQHPDEIDLRPLFLARVADVIATERSRVGMALAARAPTRGVSPADKDLLRAFVLFSSYASGDKAARDEARQWVPGSAGPRVAIAQRTLSGDRRGALSLARQALRAGDIHITDIEFWPEASPLRELSSYARLLAEFRSGEC